jgi:nitrogen fixation protein
MNYKKIAITAAAAGVMLSAAVPVLANGLGGGKKGKLEIEIKNRDTSVTNYVTTKANTGRNRIVADDDVNGGKIKTGNAWASSMVSNDVNTNLVDLCDCLDLKKIKNVEVEIKNRNTNVTNDVTTKANTGRNRIVANDDVNGGKINTGNAGSEGVVANFVNTNVVGNTP